MFFFLPPESCIAKSPLIRPLMLWKGARISAALDPYKFGSPYWSEYRGLNEFVLERSPSER